MLRESIDHAEQDIEARRLREQQVEAQRVIEALKGALAADGEQLLDDVERGAVDAALTELEGVSQGNDHIAIKRAIESLENACQFYVERRMNASVRKAMSGHSINDFE